MADIIYTSVGLAVMAWGAWLLLPGRGVLRSIEWLNSYAARKMVPPPNRVNFRHVLMWFSFTTASTVWLLSGLLIFASPAWVAACILNLSANYLTSRMSGRARVKAARIWGWSVVAAASAYCLIGLASSALHE